MYEGKCNCCNFSTIEKGFSQFSKNCTRKLLIQKLQRKKTIYFKYLCTENDGLQKKVIFWEMIRNILFKFQDI